MPPLIKPHVPCVTTTVAMTLPVAEQVRALCRSTGTTLKAFVARSVETELKRIQRKTALAGGTTS